MLNCKQVSQLISQGLDKKLSPWEQFGLKMHLFICKYCKQFNQQMQKLHVMINSIGENIENDKNITLSTEAKKRIAKSIKTSIE